MPPYRRHSRSHKLIRGLVAACVCVGVSTTLPVRADTLGDPSPLERASKLIGKGQERYDTADYIGAIELWSEAYAALPKDSEADQYRGVLVYQIANACREAYAVNREVRFLRKAEKLFQDYIDGLPAEDADSREHAEEALAEVRTQLEEIEAQDADSRPPPDPDEDDPESEPEPEPEPELEPLGNGLRIAGGVTLGLGAVGLATMGGFLGRGASLDNQGDDLVSTDGPDTTEVGELLQKGSTANKVAVAMGVVGGLLTTTGIALLVVDAVKRKKHNRRDVSVVPAVSGQYAGLQLYTRF